MTDSVTIFGDDFTGVTGIKATGTGNGTLAYIRPQGNLAITANTASGSSLDVTNYATATVNVPSQDNTFVITISWDYAEETLIPDCTYSEVQSAVQAGKQLVACAYMDDNIVADCEWNTDEQCLYYMVYYQAIDDYTVWHMKVYSLTSNGITQVWDDVIPDGNIAINGSGTINVAQYATASVPVSDWEGSLNSVYTTVSGQRKWRAIPGLTIVSAGWIGAGTKSGGAFTFNAVPSNTTVTPTTSSQTIGGANYMMEGPVTVAAMPSGSVSASATKGSVSNHAISVTPTATVGTAGYLAAGSTNGTAVSVSASELVSGTYTVDSSGTKDVTNYASASVPAGSATASATKGSVSNHSITVTPSVTRTAGWVTAGSANGTAVTVSASELVSGSETKTANGTYDVTNLAQLIVDVQGGSSGMQVGYIGGTSGNANNYISFNGLQGEPTSFVAIYNGSIATGSPAKVAAVVFDGTDLHGQTIANTSNAQVSYDTGYSKTYSDGTLYISATSSQFASISTSDYYLIYTYGGTSANVGTKDVQVGSGATSITFTGLEDEPVYWSCIFKSNFGTSSGYQRVIAVANDGNDNAGLEMDSGAHYSDAHWTASYSNGSLTITSQGTNAGGYFHQPGYYQLTYGIGGEVEPPTIEPLTVTQNGTYAESGKAYSPVTVNVSGGGSWTVKQTTWSNNSTSTVSHQFTGLSGTPKAAVLRCTSQLTRSSSNTYYYIADIVWDGTDAWGNYHLRSNGTFNNVAKDAASGFNVSVGTNSITFSSDASSRSSAPGSFYNGTYELTYWY